MDGLFSSGTIWLFLEKIIEVTVLPVAPPNWNLGVGKTVFTLKWVPKNVLSSSSVQWQDVIKKKLGTSQGSLLKVIINEIVKTLPLCLSLCSPLSNI